MNACPACGQPVGRRAPLTRFQSRVLAYLREHIERHGYAPSFKEAGEALGRAEGTIHGHVVALEEKGYLRRGPRASARSIVLTSEASE